MPAASQAVFTVYKRPKSIIARFVAKHTYKGALIWATMFGVTIVSSASAFPTLYKTEAARQQLAATFGSNAGLRILFGVPHHLETVGGFTAWRSISVIIIIGSIWGILTSTKYFRGEEEAGRSEMFMTGQTTARRATINILAGLAVALSILYIVPTICTILVGRGSDVNFTTTNSAFAGLAVVAGAAMFLSVGALTSQLAPVRKRAAMMATAVFGASFLIRAVGDVDTNLRWLQNISPLGWIEKLQPLTSPQPIWLLPIGFFIIALSGMAIFLSGKRDHGDGILKDKDTAPTRTRLLNSSLGLAFRENRYTILAWLAGASVMAALYGYLAKTAADALKGADGVNKVVGSITGTQTNIGAETIIGMMFLIVMIIMMLQATNLVNVMREEEAQGYLDNLIVRPVSRLRWLSGRILIIVSALIAGGLLAGVFGWLGETSQQVGVSYHVMFLSGLNIIPPTLLLMSIGLFVFGFRPRLTSSVMYGLIAWAFLIEMIGSAVNLNHYILDTSILHHVALSPAVDPRWHVGWLMLAISLVLVVASALRFVSRDIEAE